MEALVSAPPPRSLSSSHGLGVLELNIPYLGHKVKPLWPPILGPNFLLHAILHAYIGYNSSFDPP